MGWPTWVPGSHLKDADYATVTKNIVTLVAPLSKPTMINPKNNQLSTPYEILTLQEEMKTLQKEFELQFQSLS
jgi:hypothetical protein